jgi:ArsR family transcriptional regulator, virulence genes transcriptional regulator
MKIDQEKMNANAPQVAKLLRTLANAERLKVLCNLLGAEVTAGDLWSKSDLSQSAFSQHLGVLRAAGIVVTRKQAQTVYYTIADHACIELLYALQKIYC